MSGMNKVFYSLAVTESDISRQRIGTLKWVSNNSAVRSADLIILPWHDIEEMAEPAFPQGTADLMRFLTKSYSGEIALPVQREQYREIAMHGKAWRLPTLFITGLALPVLVNVLADKLSDALPGVKSEDTIHLELIVERPSSPCVSIKYQGPADRLPSTLIEESRRYCEEDTPLPPAVQAGESI